MMQDNRDITLISRIVLGLGAALAIGGIVLYTSAPAEPALGSPGWFEAANRHSTYVFAGFGCIGFGAILMLTGLALTMRARRVAMALTAQTAGAVAQGVVDVIGKPATAEAKLAELKTLHTRGLITDAEYEAKRSKLVDAL